MGGRLLRGLGLRFGSGGGMRPFWVIVMDGPTGAAQSLAR